MKILVTGAAGFIGSHLSEALSAQGHEVMGVDNFNDYYNPALKEMNARDLAQQDIKIERLDLATDDLSQLVDGVELVYHLAAQPGISAGTSFDDYMRNNLLATHNLLEAVKDSDTLKLFVNTATSSVYGKHAQDNEETPPKPTSYYGVTKLAAEQLALAYCRDKDVPVTSIRVFSAFGERERPEKLYPKLIRAIYLDEPFPLYEGSKEHERSYSYVGNIVDGFTLLLDQIDKAVGEIFNIGTDENITTGEGIEIVENLMGKKVQIEHLPKRPGDQLKTAANIDKARAVLGYEPKTSIADGLKKTVDWFTQKLTSAEIK